MDAGSGPRSDRLPRLGAGTPHDARLKRDFVLDARLCAWPQSLFRAQFPNPELHFFNFFGGGPQQLEPRPPIPDRTV
jgi:hypothetical protein